MFFSCLQGLAALVALINYHMIKVLLLQRTEPMKITKQTYTPLAKGDEKLNTESREPWFFFWLISTEAFTLSIDSSRKKTLFQ